MRDKQLAAKDALITQLTQQQVRCGGGFDVTDANPEGQTSPCWPPARSLRRSLLLFVWP